MTNTRGQEGSNEIDREQDDSNNNKEGTLHTQAMVIGRGEDTNRTQHIRVKEERKVQDTHIHTHTQVMLVGREQDALGTHHT